MSNIILQIGGDNYSGWKSLSSERSMEALAGSFNFEVVDKEGEVVGNIEDGVASKLWVFDPLTYTSWPIMTGYVDQTNKKTADTSDEMTIEGRDKTEDLVDCAATVKSSTWTKKFLKDICTDLCKPYGILVDTSQIVDTELIERFTLQTGDTAFSAIERLCRSKAVLPLTDNEGNLILTYAADETIVADENLELGVNILEVEESKSKKERFSNYVIRGQQSGKGKAWTAKETKMNAKAEDTGVDRYRLHVFMSENKATAKNLRDRVAWEAQVRAGRGEHYNVKVKGWFQRDKEGTIIRPWQINERINIRVDRWNVNKQQLITARRFDLSEGGGETTTLMLQNPGIYKPNPTEKVELF